MKGSKGVGGCACIAWITATCCAWLRHIVAGERAEQCLEHWLERAGVPRLSPSHPAAPLYAHTHTLAPCRSACWSFSHRHGLSLQPTS